MKKHNKTGLGSLPGRKTKLLAEAAHYVKTVFSGGRGCSIDEDMPNLTSNHLGVSFYLNHRVLFISLSQHIPDLNTHYSVKTHDLVSCPQIYNHCSNV